MPRSEASIIATS